jgi:hypothetical protein
MTKSDSHEVRICERAPFVTQTPIISHDDSRQDPAGWRTSGSSIAHSSVIRRKTGGRRCGSC